MTKDRILELLWQEKDYLSGEEMARRLSVSRTAVSILSTLSLFPVHPAAPTTRTAAPASAVNILFQSFFFIPAFLPEGSGPASFILYETPQ